MDINNQKMKENDPPSFRPAEVGGLGRRSVGLNRVFESTILKLWGGLTPLAQPTAWGERERKKKRKRKSRARTIKMGEGDLRSVAPISVTPTAIPLLYLTAKIAEITKNFCSCFCSDVCSRAAEKSPSTHFLVFARTVGDPATIIIYLIIF